MATRHVHDQLKELLKFLNRASVEYLIVGGYAVNIHGHSRPTDDIDIWVAMSEENADRLVNVLHEFIGMSPHRSVFTTPGKIVEFGVPPTRVHIMTRVSGVEFDECYKRKHPAFLDDVPTSFIGLADLRKNKEAAGRHKDLADLEELPEALDHRVAQPLTGSPKQRDLMRRLFREYKGNRERVIAEYADAERRGEVKRARNQHSLSAEDYASRLYADGLAKGWLNS